MHRTIDIKKIRYVYECADDKVTLLPDVATTLNVDYVADGYKINVNNIGDIDTAGQTVSIVAAEGVNTLNRSICLAMIKQRYIINIHPKIH